MSDWIDAGGTGGCARPDEKGCLIAIIFGAAVIVTFVVLCLLFQ